MYPLMGLDPRLIDPALVDQLATDPFQPEQGLLQRLLPMLMAPQGQTPGFGGPPSAVSAQAGQVPQINQNAPRPPVAAPMPMMASQGPGMEEIMQSQGSTNPLPYPMAGAPMMAARPPAPPAAALPGAGGGGSPSPQMGGGMLGMLGGGGGMGIMGGLLDVAKGALAGAISPQHAAASMTSSRDRQQKMQQQQMMYSALVSQGLSPQQAMLAVLNPDLAKNMGTFERPKSKEVEEQQIRIAQASREPRGPTIVSPGATAIGANGAPIFTAPEKPQPKSELEKRADAAGLVPGSPEHKDFMLRGGRNPDAPISATDKKAVFEAEDALPQIKSTLDALKRARDLNDNTFSGYGASLRGSIGTKMPGGGLVVDEKRAKATQEWEKIMAPEALQTMANTLKGATTDFELKKFIEMLGDPSVDPEIRKSVIERMITLSERKLELQQLRINDLRGGTYFKPGGGGSAAPAPSSGWNDLGGGIRIREKP
jgi:hypothetical protein